MMETKITPVWRHGHACDCRKPSLLLKLAIAIYALLFAYFVKYPPLDGMPIFHTAPREFRLYGRVSEVLKETAVRLKLDPTRLRPPCGWASSPYSILEPTLMKTTRLRAGGWRTMPGMMPYEKDTQAIGRADRTAVAMNNTKSVSIAVVRHAFTAVNPGAKRGYGSPQSTSTSLSTSYAPPPPPPLCIFHEPWIMNKVKKAMLLMLEVLGVKERSRRWML